MRHLVLITCYLLCWTVAYGAENKPEEKQAVDRHFKVPKHVRVSLLHDAIRQGRLDQVQRAIGLGIDPNQRGRNNETAIELAIQRASPSSKGFKMLQYLIKDGADINALSSTGDTPLIQAIKGDYIEVVQLLVAHGVKLNAPSANGDTPLMVAIQKGNEDIFDFLVRKKAALNVANKEGDTPLHWALKNSNPEMAMELLLAGVDPTPRNGEGFTPMHQAAAKGYFNVIAVLIQRGVAVDVPDSEGSNTALHLAAGDSDLDSVIFLVSSGAAVNARNAKGETPLLLAMKNSHSRPELVEFLAKHGAEIDYIDNGGETALHEAARVGNAAAVEALIRHGATIDVVDGNHQTPLYEAARYNHLDVVKVLLEHHAYINTSPSALQGAIEGGDQDIIHLIIKKGGQL